MEEEVLNPLEAVQDNLKTIMERQRLYKLGKRHEDAGKIAQAIAVYREYAEVLEEADRVYPWLWNAKLYLDLKNTTAALECYRKALALSPVKAQQNNIKRIIKKLETPAT